MKTISMLAAALWLGLAGPAAAEVKIIAGEVAPFVYVDGGAAKGVAHDLTKELAKRVGHSGNIETMPFVRALDVGKQGADILLIPIGRNEAREKSYQWVVKLVDEEFVLIGKQGGADVSSFDAAKSAKVGVMRDSVGARIAKDKGMGAVEDVPKEEVNAQKLSAGRIDAWVAAWNTAMQAQRNAGLDPKQLKRGAVASRVGIYLAASPQVPKEELDKWRAAFEALKKDGAYDRIIKAYAYELPN